MRSVIAHSCTSYLVDKIILEMTSLVLDVESLVVK